MTLRHPEILSPEPAGITRAADLLRQGGLVALPTETVYGLGADARNGAAVARVYEAKGRPSFNPLIVHVANVEAVAEIAELPVLAKDLAVAFWPGPLTLVLPLKPDAGIAGLVSAGLPTIAIRIPAHPVARAVLEAFGGPVAAPSANPSGRISPTTAAHVRNGLGTRVDAILDGGACAVGLESTIVAVDGATARLLREGGLPREALEPLTGLLSEDLTPGRVEAPGQLESHYAPVAKVTMNSDLSDALAVRIGFGPSEAAEFNLSPSGDLREAAARLFDLLHAADAMARETGVDRIAVAPVPDTGLGRAINDRLKRASA